MEWWSKLSNEKSMNFKQSGSSVTSGRYSFHSRKRRHFPFFFHKYDHTLASRGDDIHVTFELIHTDEKSGRSQGFRGISAPPTSCSWPALTIQVLSSVCFTDTPILVH